MSDDSYITLQEAASYLGVTTQTLRNWDKNGKLKAVRNPVNRYRMYRLEDVTALQSQPQLFPCSDDISTIAARHNKPLTAAELRRIVRSLHRILRDSEGNSSLMERFDEMTKILYCKIHDENRAEQAKRPPAFRIAENDSPRSVAKRVRDGFRGQVERNRDLFPARFSKINLSDSTIFQIVETLAPVQLSRTSEDLKGLVYEEVIRNTFEKGDNQQFFTPRTVVEFMVNMIGPALTGTICDPACGTGGFLLSAETFLRTNGSRKKVAFLGVEIDERLSWATGINLDMHGVRNFSVHSMGGAASLGSELFDYFETVDAIITNPPFGSDLTDDSALADFTLGKGKTSRRRGVLFIERCLELLKPGGVVAIIIDEGVLNGPTNTDTRHLILEQSHPFAIVSLPETAFMPYASVKSSILFLQKKGGRKRNLMRGKNTFFAKAEVVGRKPNGDPLFRINPVTGRQELDSDLPDVLAKWQRTEESWANDENGCFYAEMPDVDDEEFMRDGYRIDLAYHHPSRHEATEALQTATYPLMSLDEICDIRNEAAIPSKDFEDDDIPYIGLANIQAKTGLVNPVVVPGATLKSTVKRYLPGDILFAKMRPELRKVCLIPSDFDEGYASAECIVLVPKIAESTGKPLVLPELLALLLRTDLVYGQIVHLVIGIGRPRLSKAAVLGVKIPVPPLAIQQKLVRQYAKSESASQELMAESEAAAKKAKRLVAKASKTMVEDLLRNERPKRPR